MLNSMTGFTRHQAETQWGQLTWELKSVNHRYLETSFKLPDTFRHLEMSWREMAKKQLRRGKVELALKFIPSVAQNEQIDEQKLGEVANHLLKAHQLLTNTNSQAMPLQIQLVDLLKWPGVLNPAVPDQSKLDQSATQTLEAALLQLKQARKREGTGLYQLIKTRIEQVEQLQQELRNNAQDITATLKAQLEKKISQLAVEIDETRLAQEVAIQANKYDVLEELDRLAMHCQEVNRTLEKDESVGRRLDFLMQELNREANTLGSKSVSTLFSKSAIELKVLIEQMREQIQNIE